MSVLITFEYDGAAVRVVQIHDPAHLDSIVDVAGNAACLREITNQG